MNDPYLKAIVFFIIVLHKSRAALLKLLSDRITTHT